MKDLVDVSTYERPQGNQGGGGEGMRVRGNASKGAMEIIKGRAREVESRLGGSAMLMTR